MLLPEHVTPSKETYLLRVCIEQLIVQCRDSNSLPFQIQKSINMWYFDGHTVYIVSKEDDSIHDEHSTFVM